MRDHLVTTGRRLALALEPGDEVIGSIAEACRAHGFDQAIVVMLSGALRTARLIGTTDHVADPELPLPQAIDVHYVEGIGSGTVSRDGEGTYAVHVHVALGEKNDGARSVAGHLLSAETHYVVEVVLDEVLAPRFTRVSAVETSGVPALAFAPEGTPE